MVRDAEGIQQIQPAIAVHPIVGAGRRCPAPRRGKRSGGYDTPLHEAAAVFDGQRA